MSGDPPLRLAVALNGYGPTRPGGRDVLPWPDHLRLAITAEETGYEAVFTPEIGAREAFSTLTGFALATSHVRLATGVVPLGSRAPLRMAMEAATLQDLSGGRAILGLGSLRSLADTRAEVEEIRRLLGGGALDLSTEPVPIYLAALGPRMAELAGEVADGVVLNWCSPERVSRAREEISRGAEAAGRDPSEVRIAVYVRCCLGPDATAALEALAAEALRYAGMPHYLRQLEAMGLGEAARAARAGDPAALVDSLCARGGREEVFGRLGEYRAAGADLVVVYPVPVLDAVSSILGTIMALAPHPAVER